MELNDFELIEELRELTPGERLRRLNALGDEAAEHFRRALPAALATHEHVIAVTHARELAQRMTRVLELKEGHLVQSG